MAYVPPNGIPNPGLNWAGSAHPIDSVRPTQPAGWPSTPDSTHWYIDPQSAGGTASAGDPGTPSSPKQQWSNPVPAGTTVWVKPGNHQDTADNGPGTRWVFNSSGTSSNPAWLCGDDGGDRAATYTSSGSTVTVTSASHGLSTTNIIAVRQGSDSLINGQVAVTVTGTDTFTFTTLGSDTPSPATGSLVWSMACIYGRTSSGGQIECVGTYGIVDGVDWRHAGSAILSYSFRDNTATDPADRVCVRRATAQGPGTSGSSSVISGGSGGTETIGNCCVYDVSVRDFGDWTSTSQNDTLAAAHAGWDYFWMLESTCFRMGADCGRSGTAGGAASATNHGYWGGIHTFENGEDGFDIKSSTDVSISTCVLHDFDYQTTPGNIGHCIIFHNNMAGEHAAIWNTCHTAGTGVGSSGSGADRLYIWGNTFRGIYRTDGTPFDPDDTEGGGNGVTIWWRSNTNNRMLVCNNTLHNCEHGIEHQSGTTTENLIHGNIFNEMVDDGVSAGIAIQIPSGSTGVTTVSDNMFNQTFDTMRIFWGATEYTSSAAFNAAVGTASGNVDDDPLLSDPDNDDYALQSGSPAIDGTTVHSATKAAYMTRFGVDIEPDFASGAAYNIGAYQDAPVAPPAPPAASGTLRLWIVR